MLRWGEIGIGSSLYGGLQDLTYPTAAGLRIMHATALSTRFPVKELGHLPSAISGVLHMTAPRIPAFIADVRAGGSERKVRFLHGSTECYVYARSGDVTANRCLNFRAREAVRVHEVAFTFPLTRTMVYRASDDAVLWGF